MYGAFAYAWSRRVMIIIFGDSGFSVFHAGHCDWQRPHSVQEAKSSSPFQVKSSTLPMPRRRVLVEVVDVLEVDRLAGDRQRARAAESEGWPLEEDVDRRDEDVQVLGVQHLDQEDQHHADVQQQADPLEDGVRRVPEPAAASRPTTCDM